MRVMCQQCQLHFAQDAQIHTSKFRSSNTWRIIMYNYYVMRWCYIRYPRCTLYSMWCTVHINICMCLWLDGLCPSVLHGEACYFASHRMANGPWPFLLLPPPPFAAVSGCAKCTWSSASATETRAKITFTHEHTEGEYFFSPFSMELRVKEIKGEKFRLNVPRKLKNEIMLHQLKALQKFCALTKPIGQ